MREYSWQWKRIAFNWVIFYAILLQIFVYYISKRYCFAATEASAYSTHHTNQFHKLATFQLIRLQVEKHANLSFHLWASPLWLHYDMQRNVTRPWSTTVGMLNCRRSVFHTERLEFSDFFHSNLQNSITYSKFPNYHRKLAKTHSILYSAPNSIGEVESFQHTSQHSFPKIDISLRRISFFILEVIRFWKLFFIRSYSSSNWNIIEGVVACWRMLLNVLPGVGAQAEGGITANQK